MALAPRRTLAHHRAQIRVRHPELALEDGDVGREALPYESLTPAEDLAQPVLLRLQHLEQLPTPGEERLERARGGVGDPAHDRAHQLTEQD